MSEKSEARKKLKGTPVGEVADQLDDNTRGVAKVISAWCYIGNGGIPDYGPPPIFDKALRELLAERRALRDKLEDYLKHSRRRG
jgi:hypothetical protein